MYSMVCLVTVSVSPAWCWLAPARRSSAAEQGSGSLSKTPRRGGWDLRDDHWQTVLQTPEITRMHQSSAAKHQIHQIYAAMHSNHWHPLTVPPTVLVAKCISHAHAIETSNAITHHHLPVSGDWLPVPLQSMDKSFDRGPRGHNSYLGQEG